MTRERTFWVPECFSWLDVGLQGSDQNPPSYCENVTDTTQSFSSLPVCSGDKSARQQHVFAYVSWGHVPHQDSGPQRHVVLHQDGSLQRHVVPRGTEAPAVNECQQRVESHDVWNSCSDWNQLELTENKNTLWRLVMWHRPDCRTEQWAGPRAATPTHRAGNVSRSVQSWSWSWGPQTEQVGGLCVVSSHVSGIIAQRPHWSKLQTSF